MKTQLLFALVMGLVASFGATSHAGLLEGASSAPVSSDTSSSAWVETESSSYFSGAPEGSAVSSTISVVESTSKDGATEELAGGSLALLLAGNFWKTNSLGQTLSPVLPPLTPGVGPQVAPVPELPSGALVALAMGALALSGARRKRFARAF